MPEFHIVQAGITVLFSKKITNGNTRFSQLAVHILVFSVISSLII